MTILAKKLVITIEGETAHYIREDQVPTIQEEHHQIVTDHIRGIAQRIAGLLELGDQRLIARDGSVKGYTALQGLEPSELTELYNMVCTIAAEAVPVKKSPTTEAKKALQEALNERRWSDAHRTLIKMEATANQMLGSKKKG